MKICFFGIYNPEYSRNRVLISGFKQNGFEVFECKVDPRLGKIKKYFALFEEYKKVKEIKFDYVLVAFPGHSVLWFAYLLFGKDIVFDAFVSLYDSNVRDRKMYRAFSLKGFRDWFLDWHSCLLAKKVILDTDAHIDFFVDTFRLDRKKIIRVFVGSDETLFFPEEKNNEDKKDFVIHFHGSNIPLQGVGYIFDSAKILEKHSDIKFNIIGSKIKKEYGQNVLSNINLIENVPYENLRKYMVDSDVCLGIFGDTEKAKRVIPNKIFEAIACKKPVITADTIAIKELFKDNESIALCQAADSESLAQRILSLRGNDVLRDKIAKNSFNLFKSNLIPSVLVRKLLDDLK